MCEYRQVTSVVTCMGECCEGECSSCDQYFFELESPEFDPGCEFDNMEES